MLIGAAASGSPQVSARSGQVPSVEHARASSPSPESVKSGTYDIGNVPNLPTWVVTVPCQYMIFPVNKLIFL
jgi:hypothetical protein